MPRRPRPASRKPPTTEQSKVDESSVSSESDSESQESSSIHESDQDADAPRVSQWVDEDDLSEPELPVAGPSKLNSLKDGLSSLPLGTLRRAQNVLDRTDDTSESGESSDGKSDSEDDSNKLPHRSELSSIKKSSTQGKPSKRSNKNAPMEMSSKRPVSRKRTVVQANMPEARDPRFLPMTGELSTEKFQANYSFLKQNHTNELDILRQNLKRARKLLVNSPKNLRPERENEVQRLEIAVKRAESAVNRDRQQDAERNALNRVRKEETEKRKEGKGNWWMKDAAKKELLVKARYEALASQGGQRAVKKAIEKKRKKIGQKEKRSRPFPKGTDSSGDRAHKRRKVG